MGLRIATNIASISAQRAMGTQSKRQEHAAQALASGSRIVHASDDAAGLAISETMKSEVRGLGQARSNANNAISAIQIGEGGLAEQTNLLTRLKELGIQSASDNFGEKERVYMQQEASTLVEELDRISQTTKFGDKNLIDGSQNTLEFQVGTQAGAENIIKYESDSEGATASALGVAGTDISSKSGARDLIANVNTAIDKVSKMRAGFGALQSRLESTVGGLDMKTENISAARSRISDADVAKESSDLASASMLQAASLSVLAQANQQPMVAMKLIG